MVNYVWKNHPEAQAGDFFHTRRPVTKPEFLMHDPINEMTSIVLLNLTAGAAKGFALPALR
jgi:hypothetical protein